jgi:hypothetical protein
VPLRLSALLFCLSSFPASAQEAPVVPIPVLAARASGAAGFTPIGWRVEAQARGDLNGDGRQDLAFVLKATESTAILRDESSTRELDTNPRILAVAVATIESDYALVAQNATLIPRHVFANLDDAFEEDGLSISRGAVRVRLRAFANAGGADMANVQFAFRLAKGGLRLVGYDRTDVHRMTGAMSELSVNYLSGRMSRAKGSIEDDKLKKVWSKAPAKAPTLDEIGDGLDFDPTAR